MKPPPSSNRGWTDKRFDLGCSSYFFALRRAASPPFNAATCHRGGPRLHPRARCGLSLGLCLPGMLLRAIGAGKASSGIQGSVVDVHPCVYKLHGAK